MSKFTSSITRRTNEQLSLKSCQCFSHLSRGTGPAPLFQRHLLAAKQSMEIWIHSWTQISHVATHHTSSCPTSSRKTLSLNWHTSPYPGVPMSEFHCPLSSKKRGGWYHEVYKDTNLIIPERGRLNWTKWFKLRQLTDTLEPITVYVSVSILLQLFIPTMEKNILQDVVTWDVAEGWELLLNSVYK